MQLKTVQQPFILQKSQHLEIDGVTHMYSSQFIHVWKILTKIIDSLNALFYTTTNQIV